MQRKYLQLAMLALPICLASAPALAQAEGGPAHLLLDSLGGETSGVRALSDEELSTKRGGYGGVFFSLFAFGDLDTLGGQLPAGTEITSLTADQVSLSLGLAQLPNTGGFLQFASVVGNNNVVNNNLILNVYFLEGGVADTSSLTNGSALGF
ncbi:hypothetical protein [Altererythrobacter aquiaggeris]|uniref:hypothetical protein n=1 Tax=Aestuarierythrobacter aquiaggeris TaxID=1898396 RepID=UPI003019863E